MLSKKPFNLPRSIAAAIAKASTYQNKLPQGAPTSPILSNLICSKLDSQLRSLARKHNCSYSRYADDITFSTHRSRFSLAHTEIDEGGSTRVVINAELLHIIETNGFKLNAQKTRLFQKIHRQEVTGLIVNQHVNVKRRYIRNIRGALHAWRKYGFPDAQKTLNEKFGIKTSLDDFLLGQISFVGQIRGKSDQVFRKLVREFNELQPRAKIQIKLTPREIAEQATWVVEDFETDNQGTAFFVKDVGIATCAHCVNSKPFIYHRNWPEKKFPLVIRKRDSDRDLVIFNIPEALSGILPLDISVSTHAIETNSTLTLLGYPNHSKFMPIRIESGHEIRRFVRHSIGFLEISPRVREGNSGGPVVDSNFRVIAIASKGANHDTSEAVAEYIAINVNELLNMAN